MGLPEVSGEVPISVVADIRNGGGGLHCELAIVDAQLEWTREIGAFKPEFEPDFVGQLILGTHKGGASWRDRFPGDGFE